MIITSLLAYLIGLQYVYCANILYVAPLPTHSHHVWNGQLALALAQKGHNITMIGHEIQKTKVKNFNNLVFEGVYEKIYIKFNSKNLFIRNPIIGIRDMYDYIDSTCQWDFETEGLKVLLKYPKDAFDIILFDATCALCLYPIIDYFNVPVIAATPFLLPNYLSNAMGNHWYTSYMPHYTMAASNTMCFTDRVASFFLVHLELFIRNYYYMAKYKKYAESYFGKEIRPLEEYEKNFTLLLCNTDPILDFPIPLPPNIISVGGLHIQPAKPVSNEFEEIMKNAKDGVILFSLGSVVNPEFLPKHTKSNIIKAFAKLKETVLWKCDTAFEGLPKNVIIKKWLPQNDILGHPNTKLFISHGGALSTQEAMYHGVPTLGIPVLADQYNNVEKLVARKLGLKVDHNKLTASDFYGKIIELLTDPIYSKNMKKVSAKFRDQPQNASELAVFWIEHVLKHGPLDELTLPTNNMNIFQLYSLDVVAFFTILIIAFLLFIRKLFKLIFCRKCIIKEKHH